MPSRFPKNDTELALRDLETRRVVRMELSWLRTILRAPLIDELSLDDICGLQHTETGVRHAYAPRRSSESPPSVGFTDTFKRNIKSVDKILKGRILEAIVVIAEEPETVRGDTMKPLGGDLKGCWRYRIGDHRIVYKPEPQSRTVWFLDFGPRGDIYSS